MSTVDPATIALAILPPPVPPAVIRSRPPQAGIPPTKADRDALRDAVRLVVAVEADPAADSARLPAFLLLPNHFAIRRYNNSAAYALGVGMLADGFMGQPGLVRPWPVETPLSLTDRIDAQKALAALGFSPGNPDGIVGTNTRSALKAWQKVRGLVADGYLSIDMINRLRAETGLTPAT
jgi:hypothetical protein